ncbi:MAG: hypothetical protein JSU01_03175 [Bacteroidetes bacterium]|nr:hypothetical protein [Bacteroidota bacterium]
MKITSTLFQFKAGILILMTAFAISCSKNGNVGPTPLETNAQLLVQSGEWFTTGGTLTKDDGTTLVLAGNDPFLKTILLYNVTFFANGTATDTNDPNGLTQNGLTWQLTGTHLLVHVNFNNTDRVDAMITYLDQYKLVLKDTDFYVYNGVTYTGLIQTFGH